MLEKRNTISGLLFGSIAVMYLSAVALWLLIDMSGVKYSDILTRLLWLVALGYVVYLIVISVRIKSLIEKRTSLIDKIVQSKGWHAGRSTQPQHSPNFKLVMKTDHEYLHAFGDKNWRYGDFRQIHYRHTRYGDYKAVEEYYSILELDLKRKLPNIFFDSHSGHGRQYWLKFSSNQIADLEGGISDVYNVYFPVGYHIDARSIISPEVLWAIKNVAYADIELLDDKLYLYAPLMPPERLVEFVEAGKELRRTLADHIEFYRDERTSKGASRTSISRLGARLRKRPRLEWGALLVFVLYVGGIWFFTGSLPMQWGYLAMAVVLVATFVVSGYYNWWKVIKHNKKLDKQLERYLIKQQKS